MDAVLDTRTYGCWWQSGSNIRVLVSYAMLVWAMWLQRNIPSHCLKPWVPPCPISDACHSF